MITLFAWQDVFLAKVSLTQALFYIGREMHSNAGTVNENTKNIFLHRLLFECVSVNLRRGHTLYTMPYAQNPQPYTLHCHTLYPLPYALYPLPNNLLPIPYT